MAYFYRIIFNDESKRDVVPNSLAGKKLSSFDSFSMSEDFDKFIEETCLQMGLSKHSVFDIKIVKEDRRFKEIEYNLLKNNPYFYDVAQNVSRKEVWEYNYKTEREIISTESECYQEMRDYVLNQLKRNSKEFLTNIYKYNNKFKPILEKYANGYLSSDLVEEDYHNLYELETTIRHHLAIYKIYRTMANARYYYEKKNGRYQAAPKKEAVEKEYPYPEVEAVHQTLEDKVNEYNDKYEEFIEPHEYDQMAGGFDGKVL